MYMKETLSTPYDNTYKGKTDLVKPIWNNLTQRLYED